MNDELIEHKVDLILEELRFGNEKLLRSLFHLACVVHRSALMLETQQPSISRELDLTIRDHLKTMNSLLNPEFAFSNPQTVAPPPPTTKPQQQQHERHDQGDHPRLPHV